MPPLPWSNDTHYTLGKDDEYEALRKRAEQGEYEVWQVQGKSGDVYLFGHPQELTPAILMMGASSLQLLQDEQQEPILMYEPEAIKEWKRDRNVEFTAQQEESIRYYREGFAKARQGLVTPYAFVHAMPLQMETEEDLESFAANIDADPYSAGLASLIFDESGDAPTAARHYQAEGGEIPELLMPIRPEDYDAAEEYWLNVSESIYAQQLGNEDDADESDSDRRASGLLEKINEGLLATRDRWFVNDWVKARLK
jgi:hypothetical protein